MKKVVIFLSVLILFTKGFSEEDENITSLKSDRRDTLLYGIDSEVKELIAKLTKDSIEGFDTELKFILESTSDDTLKIAILDYFYKIESKSGEETAIKI